MRFPSKVGAGTQPVGGPEAPRTPLRPVHVMCHFYEYDQQHTSPNINFVWPDATSLPLTFTFPMWPEMDQKSIVFTFRKKVSLGDGLPHALYVRNPDQ